MARKRAGGTPATAALERAGVSGCRRGLDLEMAPADLVAITGAIVDRVGRD